MMNAILIDDEESARTALAAFLKKYCEEVQLVAQANSVKTGTELLLKEQPDLVFLDIQMGDGTGFDLLDKIGLFNFELIFVTAYDEYAIKAIKYSASDYLLKPVHPEELKKAVENAHKHIQIRKEKERLVELKPASVRTKSLRICIPDLKGLTFLQADDIICLQTAGKYTTIKVKDGSEYVSLKSLKEYEVILDNQGFFRIHNSTIVNLSHILRYLKGEGGYVVMINKDQLEVARRKKPELMERLTFLSA